MTLTLNALVGIQKTTVQLKVRNLLMSQFGLNQILNEPTHITKNSSTCIDLLFTSQTNLAIESGMHSSLYPNRQVSIFYDTILNIISNFILHENIICDDREPPWIKSNIKKVIHEKIKNIEMF